MNTTTVLVIFVDQHTNDETCPGCNERISEYTPPKPGDLCQILSNGRVRHFRCDQHPDGTVTDVRTGKVIR